MRPRWTSKLLVLVALALLAAVVMLWRALQNFEPSAPPVATEATAPPSASGEAVGMAAARILPTAAAPPDAPRPASTRARLGGHTGDPCTSVIDPQIPANYEQRTVQGVTLAWPSNEMPARFSPTVLAYAAAGILEEAATLTRTVRRETLVIFVYPSEDEFHRQSGAATWAGASYEAGAVQLPVGVGDLGVAMGALRHEVMHAQLHAAVGCMPAWLNEGVAMYFDAGAPLPGWLRILHGTTAPDTAALYGSSFTMLSHERASDAYAFSLAMILHIVGSGEDGVGRAIHVVQHAEPSRRLDLALWLDLYPGLTRGVELDSLARRLFGVERGAKLDTILAGAICCRRWTSLHEISCYPAPKPQSESSWFDESLLGWCRTSW